MKNIIFIALFSVFSANAVKIIEDTTSHNKDLTQRMVTTFQNYGKDTASTSSFDQFISNITKIALEQDAVAIQASLNHIQFEENDNKSLILAFRLANYNAFKELSDEFFVDCTNYNQKHKALIEKGIELQEQLENQEKAELLMQKFEEFKEILKLTDTTSNYYGQYIEFYSKVTNLDISEAIELKIIDLDEILKVRNSAEQVKEIMQKLNEFIQNFDTKQATENSFDMLDEDVAVAATQTTPEAVVQTATEPKSEVQTATEPKGEVVAAIETVAQTTPKAEPKAEVQTATEAEPEVQAALEAEPKGEVVAALEAVAQTTPKDEPKAEEQSAPETTPKAEKQPAAQTSPKVTKSTHKKQILTSHLKGAFDALNTAVGKPSPKV